MLHLVHASHPVFVSGDLVPFVSVLLLLFLQLFQLSLTSGG